MALLLLVNLATCLISTPKLILFHMVFEQALSGVYAKDIHVRMACLNAVKCIPAVSNCSIPQDVEVATSLWLALHDTEKVENSFLI